MSQRCVTSACRWRHRSTLESELCKPVVPVLGLGQSSSWSNQEHGFRGGTITKATALDANSGYLDAQRVSWYVAGHAIHQVPSRSCKPVDASQSMQASQLRQEAFDNETARPVLSTLDAKREKRAASLPLGKLHASRSLQAGHVGASQTGPAFCHASAMGKQVKLR